MDGMTGAAGGTPWADGRIAMGDHGQSASRTPPKRPPHSAG